MKLPLGFCHFGFTLKKCLHDEAYAIFRCVDDRTYLACALT